MLGLDDFIIFLVFSLCILCAIFCVVYGLFNWNKGQEKESEEIAEELVWEKTEEKFTNL